MKLAAVLGEKFYKACNYYSSPTYNLEFVRSVFPGWTTDVFGLEQVGCAPCENSRVCDQEFISLPYYESNIDFLLKFFTQSGFRRDYALLATSLQNYDAVWIRAPSYGPLYLATRLARARSRKCTIYTHVCADAKNSWFNPKYSGANFIPAYLLSQATHTLIKYIAGKLGVVIFATGDKIHKQYENSANHLEMLIDTNVTTAVDNQHRKPINKNSPTFGFLGRITSDKGILELIEAFALGPDQARLLIAGDGPELTHAKQRVSKLGLGSRISFLGHLTQDQIGAFFEKVDILVVPSQNGYEGFPRVILEAWAHLTPIISTPTGGISSFIDGENGVITRDFSSAAISHAMRDAIENDHLKVSEISWALSQKSHWVGRARRVTALYHG